MFLEANTDFRDISVKSAIFFPSVNADRSVFCGTVRVEKLKENEEAQLNLLCSRGSRVAPGFSGSAACLLPQ